MLGQAIEQPQGRWALMNARIILPDRVATGAALVIDGPRIEGIAAPGDLGSGVIQIDAGGRYVSPGLIDIHTHGALGHTFNEPTDEAFRTITEENARRGVTGLLATLAAASMTSLRRCLECGQAWMSKAHDGARVLGMHLESPYISPAQKGALDPESIRRPDDGTAQQLLEYAAAIRIFVLAPELPGALELIRELRRAGITPAAGHSSARDEDIMAAMQAGLSHVTHLWSAMSSTVREGPWRKPGLLESALLYDGLTVEMICDNRHLPATLMKLGYKCVGADRLCSVSDATSGAGLPEGARFTMGALEYEVRDGVGMMFDRSGFAGSTTLLNQMVPILREVVGLSLPQAIRLLSANPARVAGVGERTGAIAAGRDADLAVFDEDFSAWRTMIGGRWVYARG